MHWRRSGGSRRGARRVVRCHGPLGAVLLTWIWMGTAALRGADEPTLALKGKGVTLYPAVLDSGPMPKDMGERLSEVIGTLLERAGMIPDIASEPTPFSPADGLAVMEERVSAAVPERQITTDYALFVSLTGRPKLTRACMVLSDAAGSVVWSRDETRFPAGAPASPMAACAYVVRTLRAVSDLDDPFRKNAPRGKMDERMARRSGMPPHEEVEAMRERWAKGAPALADATLTVYPFHIWGDGQGNTEGAADLARRIADASLAKASASGTPVPLDVGGDPNEARVLWDTARAFRSYLSDHPAETDYALFVDVGSLPRVGFLHLVLCTGDGEWVLVDLQNSHHPDFRSVGPHTMADCVELAMKRLRAQVRDAAGKSR